jgi:hypothetical protein
LHNFCRKIERGEDVRIPPFGNVYFNKKAHLKSLQKLKELNENHRKQQSARGNNASDSKDSDTSGKDK